MVVGGGSGGREEPEDGGGGHSSDGSDGGNLGGDDQHGRWGQRNSGAGAWQGQPATQTPLSGREEVTRLQEEEVRYRTPFRVGDHHCYQARIVSEPEFRFRTRYRCDSVDSAIQDVTREAFLRLNAIHRAEVERTERTYHIANMEGHENDPFALIT
uniref:Uncharacterized protein n=1 Tax=Oryza punctata TaxID=4537 RepID=A0A0E0M4X2_ORYPU